MDKAHASTVAPCHHTLPIARNHWVLLLCDKNSYESPHEVAQAWPGLAALVQKSSCKEQGFVNLHPFNECSRILLIHSTARHPEKPQCSNRPLHVQTSNWNQVVTHLSRVLIVFPHIDGILQPEIANTYAGLGWRSLFQWRFSKQTCIIHLHHFRPRLHLNLGRNCKIGILQAPLMPDEGSAREVRGGQSHQRVSSVFHK